MNQLFNESQNDDLPTKDPPKVIIKIPYCGKPSEILKRSIQRMMKLSNCEGISMCFTARRLSSYFQLKDVDPLHLSSSLVYCFKCSDDLNNTYIGEIVRQLARRIEDQLYL